MKHHFRGIVPILVISASFSAVATSARGAGTIGTIYHPPVVTLAPPVGAAQPVGQSNLATLCAQPVSAATCAVGDYVQQCPKSYPATHAPAECAPILKAAYQAAWGNQTTPPVSVILPATVSRDGTPLPGTLFPALPFASNTVTPIVIGNLQSFTDRYLQFMTPSVLTTPAYAPSPYGTVTMSDCTEYVWKKWGEYSWFNDVSHAVGSHYDWLIAPPSGTTAPLAGMLAPNAVRSDSFPIAWNGTTIAQRTSIPQNVFFSVVPMWLATSTDPTQRAIYSAITHGTPWITLPQAEVAWAPGQLALMNSAGVTNATFADNERRMNDYATLAAQLITDQNALAYFQANYFHTTSCPTCPPSGTGGGTTTTAMATRASSPGIPDESFMTSSARRQAIGARASKTAPPLAARTVAVPRAQSGHVAPDAVIVFPPPPPPPPQPGQPGYFDYEVGVLKAQIQLDENAVTAALVSEWSYDSRNGCFGYLYSIPTQVGSVRTMVPNAVTANACDWTPHQYAETYTDLFASEVQDAYAECIADTADNWTTISNPPATLFGFANLAVPYNQELTIGVIGANMEGHDHSVEQYFYQYENQDLIRAQFLQDEALLRAKYAAETTSLPLLGDPSTSTTIGQDMTDQNDIGGSWFGADYGYHTMWSVTPIVETAGQAGAYPDTVPHVCSMDGDALVHLYADATLFHDKKSLINVDLEVKAAPGSATLAAGHVNILGTDYLQQTLLPEGIQDGSSIGNTAIDIPIDESPGGAGISTIIPIFGIPLQVSAGVTLHAGTNVHFKATPPPVCDRNSTAFSINTAVTPYVSADANVQVDIDLGIASAGIEGNLNLVTVKVPVTGSVSLSNASSDPNQMALQLSESANLNLSELSGNIDLYAEIDLAFWSDRADVSLFSWDGLHQTVPIYNPPPQSYPLQAVNVRFHPANFDKAAVTE